MNSRYDRQLFATMRWWWLVWVIAWASVACAEPSPRTDSDPSVLLRVGTTGDYPPFSIRAADGTLEGVDIDLARDLGDALGRHVTFVPTTWPTLMEDLGANRFDLAMSGISDTPARRDVAAFSRAYVQTSKQAVMRCDARDRLADLTALDVDGVTVLVNPGGTNEAFVRRTVQRASIRVVEDNRSIFDALETNGGDVMFTDSIEALYETQRRDALCIGLDGASWEPTPIAILLPAASPLLPEVDRWLGRRLADGTVQRAFDAHVR